MQVEQTDEESFTVYMPVSGVKVQVFHCDARAMTNVIPGTKYRKYLHVDCADIYNTHFQLCILQKKP